MRIRITVAYVGTAYGGWQRQLDVRTVQGALESAAAAVAGMPIAVHGAGRTDAGVHARGQVAHFDHATRLDAADWCRALNAYLDPDVRVMSAARVADEFHARHDARGKTYRYVLDTGRIADPFLAPVAWHVGPKVDPEALRGAANELLGTMDQRAFATQPDDKGVRNRPLDAVDVCADAARTEIVVRGRSFLRYAVRGMVGTIVDVGLGRLDAAAVRVAAESGVRDRAGATAPAHGLCLDAVHYESDD